MKKVLVAFVIILALALVWSCAPQELQEIPVENVEENVTPEEPNPGSQNTLAAIPVMAPAVTDQIDNVSLTEEQLAFNKAANRFAFKMLDKLYTGTSTVYSPLSLQMVLSMVVNGAEGQTAQEILDVLGFGNAQMNVLNTYSKALLEQLPAVDTTVKVKLANAIFLNEDTQFVPAFQEQMSSTYYAPVASLPFNDTQQVKAVVNDWCSRSTRGLIPEILDDVTPNSMAILVNALYFKAQWINRYLTDPNNPFMLPFFTESGTINKEFLGSAETLGYTEADSFRMVTRAFGNLITNPNKSNYNIAILLPRETSTLADVLAECQGKDWTDLCAKIRAEYVHLRIPKFETASSYDLMAMLSALGMKRAFMESAQFEKMFTGGQVFLSRVLQKAKLTLDETGVEGAAMTLADMMASSPGTEPDPIYFYADHPFVYVIYERTSNTILFSGVFDGQ